MDKAAREKTRRSAELRVEATESESWNLGCMTHDKELADTCLPLLDALDATDSDSARLQERVNELEAAQEWRPISEAPNDALIDIWIARTDGGERWSDCYYDRICDEWRTSRPSGHLISVKARAVSHWRHKPAPPVGDR